MSYSFHVKILNILIYHNISIFDNDSLLSSIFRQKQRLMKRSLSGQFDGVWSIGKCTCLQLHFCKAGVGALSI